MAKGKTVGKRQVSGVPKVSMGSRPSLHVVSNFGNKVSAKGTLSSKYAGGATGAKSSGKKHFAAK